MQNTKKSVLKTMATLGLVACSLSPLSSIAGPANSIHSTNLANVDHNKPLAVLLQLGVESGSTCNILRDEVLTFNKAHMDTFDVGPGKYASSKDNPYNCLTIKFSQGNLSAIDSNIKLVKQNGITVSSMPQIRTVTFK